MTYQPFLPEAGSGNLEPRHVVAPLRRVLNKCEIINGRIVQIDHASRIAYLAPLEGPTRELAYDTLVLCPGSIARTLPIPGLAEQGIGFKSVAEAIYLRNHVLERMDAASSSTDPQLRRRALTFVFVGGGYAGIEAMAELEDMARDACKFYPNLGHDEMRWVLVEASGRILPEVSPAMGEYTAMQLTQRGIEVRRNTRLKSVVGGHVVLDDGDEFDCETLVWTAGVRPNPMLESTDLPLDDRKRVVCTPFLQVKGVRGRMGLRRLRGRARPLHGRRRDDRPVGAARGPPGQAARAEHHRRAARRSRWWRTSTRTPARSPRSGCTRASPRSTGSGCAASRPGSRTGPTTSPGCPP